MSRFRRLGFALWLALALLVGQHSAALHDVAHAFEALSQPADAKLPKPDCDTHFACSQLGGALAASIAPPLPVVQGTLERPARGELGVARASLPAYRSRAPPVSFA